MLAEVPYQSHLHCKNPGILIPCLSKFGHQNLQSLLKFWAVVVEGLQIHRPVLLRVLFGARFTVPI